MPDIEIPEFLSHLPIDEKRKLPIPYVNKMGDRVSFEVVLGDMSLRCAIDHTCGICGKPLDYWIVFFGGSMAAQYGSYVDPPMHERCATFSLTACPYISRQHMERMKESRQAEDVLTPFGFVDERPTQWVMGFTRKFSTSGGPDGSLVYFPEPFHHAKVYDYNEETGALTLLREVDRPLRVKKRR